MTALFANVQHIVLRGDPWCASQQLVIHFPKQSARLHFLQLLKARYRPTGADVLRPELQVSLGLTRRGLEVVGVPPNVMARFALKSPAFFAGAAVRANSLLGASGDNAPEHWDEWFDFSTLHAVLSLHAIAKGDLGAEVAEIDAIADDTGVAIEPLPFARRLPPPPGMRPGPPDAQYVHFGYRDGLSRIGIKGLHERSTLSKVLPISQHAAGEFVLGHPQDCGANPWLADPTGEVWPEPLRDFFRDGSFGVLHLLRQDVEAFDAYADVQAEAHGFTPDQIKAKLCGRSPDGQSLAQDARPGVDPADAPDFDYRDDPLGHRCPFGSHVRRMDPRDASPVEANRSRALLRRGMPYGLYGENDVGLVGQFFCASIEDQFEHLLGQWADRVPLGSRDRGRARDPLVGAHAPGDGGFEIARAGDASLMLDGMRQFTRTRGTAYLFYPSLTTFDGIADNCLWGAVDEDQA